MAQDQKNYITVGALSKYISQKFDRDPHIQRIRVLGEISNYRYRPNSHQYFSLKEDQVQINAIMFKGQFHRLNFKLEEGMKVYVTARVGVYEGGGRYQLYVENIEPDGIGSLYLALEQLKEKMKAQGLFDRPKKKICKYPKRLAVITSPSGSVIRDIITTVQRRYPIVEIVVFPTKVQGKEAAKEIVTSFKKLNESTIPFDGVILARGGGSIEDLWCFNDEGVAHAILECPLPVISSIGHETDTTIADLVADLRAPTPTAAAELSVPVLQEVLLTISQKQARLINAFRARLEWFQERLARSAQSYVLTQPERLYQSYLQNVMHLNERLRMRQEQYFSRQKQKVNQLKQAVYAYNPQQQIGYRKEKLVNLQLNLQRSLGDLIRRKEDRHIKASALLDAFSPLKIMARGYSLVEKEGQQVTSTRQLTEGDRLSIQLYKGRANVLVESLDKKEPIDRED
ncbi:exodeoxyribonuclease VII large subunit [Facklamia sp. 7083-14-GEN3]|uniref:exodeoxyribonuclease VII large subunit n=1 Tax=Facklamia sp. 7083-14-GEN3 TaxID=2973478 RepID=UPI00215B8F05|nr:exodeoxyribonuclease VII large subunit [Facklamia sp. 7083-14-GEN3]MCR8969324.1 exodeoxyribonuclease VII large subunit [Facklamia sp. 7083-14-GEN3]